MMRIIFLLLILLYSNLGLAEQNLRVISDAEIENRIKTFITPLVKAANLNPANINIRIIIDPSLNAFVTNGTNIFINSGLIIKFADDPNILYAVMAHEIAHIYAGHLIQLRGEFENMNKVAIGGVILGFASALAGAPEAGLFTGLAAMNAAQRGMLQYSREHEVEADKIAVELLYKTHNNGQGLIKFFQYLSRTDRALDPDPYLITHPLSAARIASIQNSIREKLGKFGNNITPQIKFNFKRIATKLDAYLSPPNLVIKKYQNDPYGLSIGYFRSGQFQKAVNSLDQVIANEVHNPYLWELKGQFYFENGQFSQARQYYEKSLLALPNDNIIKIELATAKINQANGPSDKELLNSAIMLLKHVAIAQPDNIITYYMLSRAYGKLGNQNKAILALAEYYFYQGAYGRSQILANKVIQNAASNSEEYLRASDIIEFTKDRQEE